MAQNRDFKADGLRFSINPDGKSVTLSELIDRNTQKVVIPSTVNNYPVTAIGPEAFRGCFRLTSVTIPDSVTSIGNRAFRGCTGLRSVTIPDSVTSIGDEAFRGCSGLKSVTIPNSVKAIGDSAFSGCSGLTSIKVASGNPIYDSRDNCNAIIETATNTLIRGCQSTIIPASVTSICKFAFSGCSGLTRVTIPDSVKSIGERAFRGCTGLTSIQVASGNPIYDSRVNCNAIIETETNTLISGCQSTIIPDSVTGIGDEAFRGCTGLASVTIPNSVTTIGWNAFSGCTGLTSVTIPDSVIRIGRVVFYGCTDLKTIKVATNNPKYDSRDNCNAIIETATKTLICGCKSTVIPDSVTSIGYRAFSGCSGLTSVTIPDSVTTIDWYAFSGCTGLKSVTIPDSVTSIGNGAFYECYRLLSITIPDSVTKINYDAFSGCIGLKQIILTGFGHNCKALPEEIQNQIEILRIGSGISEIGNLRCNPKEIWCYAEVPPRCSEGVFSGFGAVLHVPQRAAAAYFTADVWRNFSNIVFDADEKLTLSHPSVNMGLLETFQLSATAEHTQESGVVWSSSDPSIAAVSEQGVVRAILPGTCRISAALADNSAVYASCEVKVDNRVIISLDSDTIQMRAMEIHALEPKFYPRAVDVTVTSSDPGVVLPRKDGQRVQLLGLKAGECRVTLSAPDARPVTVTVVVTDNDV